MKTLLSWWSLYTSVYLPLGGQHNAFTLSSAIGRSLILGFPKPGIWVRIFGNPHREGVYNRWERDYHQSWQQSFLLRVMTGWGKGKGTRRFWVSLQQKLLYFVALGSRIIIGVSKMVNLNNQTTTRPEIPVVGRLLAGFDQPGDGLGAFCFLGM